MSVLWSEDNGHRLVSGVIVDVDGDQGTVKVPSFDDGISKFGPCSLPAGASEGDACLVAFDENNEAWIVSAGGGGGAIVEEVTAATEAVGDLTADVAALTATLTAALSGRNVKVGATTMLWAGPSTDSGLKTIPHGLGVTPVFAAVFNADTFGSYGGIAAYTTTNYGGTTFDAYGRTPVAISGTKAVVWLAIG